MTIEGVKDLNSPLILEFVEGLLSKNKFGPTNPSVDLNAGTFSLKNYKNYVDNVVQKLTNEGSTFLLDQAALKAMNPMPGRILNPIIGIGGPPPLTRGLQTDTLDYPSADINQGEMFQRNQDIHSKIRNGTYVNVSVGGPTSTFVQGPGLIFPDGKKLQDKIKFENIYNDQDTSDNFVDFNIEDQSAIGTHQGFKTVSPIPGVEYDVPDFEVLFLRSATGPGMLDENKGHLYFKPQSKIRKNEAYRLKEKALENDDVFFNAEDYAKGFVENLGDININANYLPFFFEDLRKPGRRIYFRAFLTSFREAIAPSWSQDTYFGRVDPIGTYKNTSRSFSVGFKVAAMSPAGFSSMWKKINNLTKMVYPSYRGGVMIASPVIRLRIGDVLTDGAGAGLPGFISSELSFDYTNMPWEIDAFNGPTQISTDIEVGKAPMCVDINFTFQVIHQINPAIDQNYNFTSYYFRRIGTLDDENTTVEAETEQNTSEVSPDSIADNQQSTGG